MRPGKFAGADDQDVGGAEGRIYAGRLPAGGRKVAGSNPVAPISRRQVRANMARDGYWIVRFRRRVARASSGSSGPVRRGRVARLLANAPHPTALVPPAGSTRSRPDDDGVGAAGPGGLAGGARCSAMGAGRSGALGCGRAPATLGETRRLYVGSRDACRAHGRPAHFGAPHQVDLKPCERDRHFEGGRDGYIFSPGRLLACSIQETSWPSVRSSSS